jgi:hypothetical protein
VIQLWESFARDLAAARGETFVKEFCESLLDERRAEETNACVSQRRIAAATERLDNAFVDGLGECTMRVDLTVFWHWVRRYGHKIWSDPDFVRAFKRDNPEVRVRSRSKKIQVGYR